MRNGSRQFARRLTTSILGGIHLYIVVEEAEAGFAIYDHETSIKLTMHNKYMLTSEKRSSLTLFVMHRHSVHAFRKKIMQDGP